MEAADRQFQTAMKWVFLAHCAREAGDELADRLRRVGERMIIDGLGDFPPAQAVASRAEKAAARGWGS